MNYVRLDKTGKMYLPKNIRTKMEGDYIPIVLPDSDIILHKIKRIEDPLKNFQKLPKVTEDIKTAKKEILNQALQDVE